MHFHRIYFKCNCSNLSIRSIWQTHEIHLKSSNEWSAQIVHGWRLPNSIYYMCFVCWLFFFYASLRSCAKSFHQNEYKYYELSWLRAHCIIYDIRFLSSSFPLHCHHKCRSIKLELTGAYINIINSFAAHFILSRYFKIH